MSSPPPPASNGDVAFNEDGADEPEPVMIGAGEDVTSAVLGAADSLEGMNLRANAPSPSVPRWARRRRRRLGDKLIDLPFQGGARDYKEVEGGAGEEAGGKGRQ